jgi:signal peptidase
MKKLAETTVTAVSVFAILLGIVALVAKSPISGVVPGLKASTPMVVMSGSMVPRLPVGGLVFVRPASARDVRVGDIIAFDEPQTGHGAATITTHRVVAIQQGPGEPSFRTKGDANNSVDPQLVPAASVIGIAGASVPFLGYLSVFVRSRTGFAVLVIVPAAFLVGWEVLAIVEEVRRGRETGVADDPEFADAEA